MSPGPSRKSGYRYRPGRKGGIATQWAASSSSGCVIQDARGTVPGCGWNFAFCNFRRLDEMLTPNARHQTKPATALSSKTSFLSERKSPGWRAEAMPARGECVSLGDQRPQPKAL